MFIGPLWGSSSIPWLNVLFSIPLVLLVISMVMFVMSYKSLKENSEEAEEQEATENITTTDRHQSV